MKTSLIRLSLAACGVVAFAPLAVTHAQTAVTTTTAGAALGSQTTATTTTTSEGTIQEFTPASSQLVVRTTTGSPATYSYSKHTTFVDADGNTISSETIRPGVPTTVYYTMEAGQPVVSKVVVRRTVTAPVTAVESTTVAAPAPVVHTDRTETTTTTTK